MYQVASPEYFSTLQHSVAGGSVPQPGDGAAAPKVALISERMAQRWWKNESPLGRRNQESVSRTLRVHGCDRRRGGRRGAAILMNASRAGPSTFPTSQSPVLFMDIGVRTAGDPLLVAFRGDRSNPFRGIPSSPSPTCAPWSDRFTTGRSAKLYGRAHGQSSAESRCCCRPSEFTA